ncbi:hypothetical protein EVAR_62286_1 [Eumeta japonica]|uniref:Uncharacterized protein n=1 Tax=Eumeta variegata TaxID=151549 RepID=A0A4C1ZSN3_EUMVA|nr:hypothetical protein EVAR_62286_1 [Eumeta japonica]
MLDLSEYLTVHQRAFVCIAGPLSPLPYPRAVRAGMRPVLTEYFTRVPVCLRACVRCAAPARTLKKQTNKPAIREQIDNLWLCATPEVTSALPASRVEVGHLMEKEGRMGHRTLTCWTKPNSGSCYFMLVF